MYHDKYTYIIAIPDSKTLLGWTQSNRVKFSIKVSNSFTLSLHASIRPIMSKFLKKCLNGEQFTYFLNPEMFQVSWLMFMFSKVFSNVLTFWPSRVSYSSCATTVSSCMSAWLWFHTTLLALLSSTQTNDKKQTFSTQDRLC